jgi:LPPG:FO 2-phospho-L-lactate transferase
MITVLSGGRGTPKLLMGLRRVLGDSRLIVIVNTADDIWWNGLYVSPDLDTVIYLFANILDTNRFWGVKGDTFHFLTQAKRYGIDWPWFNIGDRDLAMHVTRTFLMNKGYTLSKVTKYITSKLGIESMILPATDDKIDTYVTTSLGKLHIQEYLVKHRAKLDVSRIEFIGLGAAKAAPNVCDAIESSDLIIIGPSNPINSIGPIIHIKEIKEALRNISNPILAVSPIKAGRPYSGPADKFMKAEGFEPSPIGLAELYKDHIDYLIIDAADSNYASEINRSFDIDVCVTDISINNLDDSIRLAKEIFKFTGINL